MHAPFPHLAEPLQLRHLTLRNRVVFGAHTANMSELGLPGRQHLGYYVELLDGTEHIGHRVKVVLQDIRRSFAVADVILPGR